MPQIALAAFVVLALSLPSPAATLRVPSEYPTIQAGVDAAAGGDTVLVAPGTYYGAPDSATCVVFNKGISLLSEAGADHTVIDGEGARRVVGSSTSASRTLRGFTLRNGSTSVGAGASFGTIGSGTCTIADNIFEDNVASSNGGGLACASYAPSSVLVQGNVFRRNTAYTGAAIWSDSYRLTLDSNVLVENGPGSAVYAVLFYAQLAVTSCVIANSGVGIGVLAQCGDFIDVRNSTFAGCRWAILTESAVTLNVAETVIEGDIYANVSNLQCDPSFTFDHVDLFGQLQLSCCDDEVPVTWRQPNLNADPQFCAPHWNDFTVSSGSPCLPQNNPWGVLIGARGQGCEAPVSLERESWARIKARYR